jgi:predicted branched-subunit amino acid permease
LGPSGTYISFVAGSIADVRLPAITMAQKISGMEAGTPEGNIISTMAVASSVAVTVTIITIFTVIGTQIIPHLPKFITDSFEFILPALFAAVYADMASKDFKTSIPTIFLVIVVAFLLPVIGIPTSYLALIAVIIGILCSRFSYKSL